MLALYYESVIEHIDAITPDILLWVIIFLFILTLCTLHLAIKLRKESSARAIRLADDCLKKVEEVEIKLDSVNRYLRDVFKKELGGAMDSFDTSVEQVLKEMKDELVQGVSKIEHIETAVRSRQKLNIQLIEGGEQAASMLGEPAPGSPSIEPPSDQSLNDKEKTEE
ncbi:MAG: hypothetical protein EOL87_09590 [Spartobacteria bacterium]|nr:hypothetical protein [Spartobacteria bacterium]